MYNFQFVEVGLYLSRFCFEHSDFRAVDGDHLFFFHRKSHVVILLIVVVVAMNGFGRTVKEILLDEGLRKKVDFRLYVRLKISIHLEIHVGVCQYLLESGTILFVVLQHRLNHELHLFRYYYLEWRASLLVRFVIVFGLYLF